MSAGAVHPAKDSGQVFIPREHGATAMLLTPFFAAAILLRQVYWPEFAALVAIVCAFALKDPLVVLARQRFVWRQEHPETKSAKRSAVVQLMVLLVCGIALMVVRDWRPFLLLFLGSGSFTSLAVVLTLRNRQRSEWFQVASAIALTSTSLAACLSATGAVPQWGWWLWLLCSLQAAAGIFVVHARLDARIAARKQQAADQHNRRAAFVCLAVLLLVGVFFLFRARAWIATALFLAAACYLLELTRQTNKESLQTPLTRIGLQALGLSTVYTAIVIAGLWRW
jgi:hypothetical protein